MKITLMLVISTPYADFCLHQQTEENVNGRAIFVIGVVEWIRIFITGTANLFNWKCKKVDEQISKSHGH